MKIVRADKTLLTFSLGAGWFICQTALTKVIFVAPVGNSLYLSLLLLFSWVFLSLFMFRIVIDLLGWINRLRCDDSIIVYFKKVK